MGSYETKKIFARNLSYLLQIHDEKQADLAAKMNVAPSSVSAWCTGEKMPRMDKIEWIANHFGVGTSALLEDQTLLPSNLSPMPPMKKIPLLGEIACGEPILAEENISDYIDVPGHIKADFSLTCKGDSMIDAGIKDGDIVYIRQQPTIENGQIAAVLIDNNEATLKRVYVNKDHIILQSANSAYPPMVYGGNIPVKILGKAVAFIHLIK